MSDTKLIQVVLDKVSSMDKDMNRGFEGVNERIDKVESNLTERIDKIGLQVARLEDDAPTVEEFDDLKQKVAKIQHHLALD